MPTGILKKWLGDKGFGFITPDDGSGDLFAHIRQKAGAPEEPMGGQEGRRVTFQTEMDIQKGKPKAASWAFMDGVVAAAPAPGAPAPPPAPVDYKALVQAANVAAAAIAAGTGGQAAGDHLLANLAGLAGGLAGGGAAPAPAPVHVPPPAHVAAAAALPPPPPPAPTKHHLEEVEVPEQVVTELFGQAGGGIEEIKKRAGGDIMIELTASETSNGSRILKIRGPAVSASLGACLVLQRVAEVV